MTDITAILATGRSFPLAGPNTKPDPLRTPVRGDIAHVCMAGRWFVPQYVVPLERSTTPAETTLYAAAALESEALLTLPHNSLIDVLDIAGTWAWGQVRTSGNADAIGLVGYIPIDSLA